jgi:hypothetical protein
MSWLLDPMALPAWLVIVIQWHGIALGAWCMWANMKLRGMIDEQDRKEASGAEAEVPHMRRAVRKEEGPAVQAWRERSEEMGR